jgi:hypothetical protein
MHSATVARQSPALDKLVNGQFSEAREGHAVLESVDEKTFALFVEYAYTGDFTIVDPSYPKKDSSVWWHNKTPEAESASGSWKTHSSSNRPSENDLWTTFIRVTEGLRKLNDADSKQVEGRPRAAAGDNAEALFQTARLYVFADYYGVTPLMNITLNRLGRGLMGSYAWREEPGVIVALLRYCYDAPASDKLKSLVVLYAACRARDLWKNNDFQELVLGDRELNLALMNQLMGVWN